MAAIQNDNSDPAPPPVAILQTASSAIVCRMAPGVGASPRANQPFLIAAMDRSRPDRTAPTNNFSIY